MNKNDKGFSFVEILVVLGVIGFIVGVGWYVWTSNQSKTTSKTPHGSTTQTNNQPAESADTQNVYQSEEYNVSFAYPKGWAIGESASATAEPFSVHVSPRVKKATASTNQTSIEEYKDDLALFFSYLSPDSYKDFVKDNYFNPVKILGDISIDGKQLKLVTNSTGLNSSIIFAECDSSGTCNNYINYGDGKYGYITISSVLQNRLHPTTVDTNSEVFKQLLQVAESIKR